MIREKHIKSGKLFEADFYPVWDDGRKMPTRAPKTKRTSAEQAKYNKLQAQKKLIRLINANFDNEDIIMHPTYQPDKAPQTEKEARRDIVNYLRRIKTRRKNELKKISKFIDDMPIVESLKEQRKELIKQKKKLESPFKYIYVIERVKYKTGKYAGRDNYHFHLFVTGGLNRNDYEKVWHSGIRTNADRFQPERYGPEAIAKYMSKNPQGSKRFCHSLNLAKPKESEPKDGKITPRGLERLAKNRIDDRLYWERRYKGYRFVRCYARFNPYNGHWYISVIMYKTNNGTLPRWEIDEWIKQ